MSEFPPPVEVTFEERRALAWALNRLQEFSEDPRCQAVAALHEKLWRAHDGYDIHPSRKP